MMTFTCWSIRQILLTGYGPLELCVTQVNSVAASKGVFSSGFCSMERWTPQEVALERQKLPIISEEAVLLSTAGSAFPSPSYCVPVCEKPASDWGLQLFQGLAHPLSALWFFLALQTGWGDGGPV